MKSVPCLQPRRPPPIETKKPAPTITASAKGSVAVKPSARRGENHKDCAGCKGRSTSCCAHDRQPTTRHPHRDPRNASRAARFRPCHQSRSQTRVEPQRVRTKTSTQQRSTLLPKRMARTSRSEFAQELPNSDASMFRFRPHYDATRPIDVPGACDQARSIALTIQNNLIQPWRNTRTNSSPTAERAACSPTGRSTCSP